MGRFFLYCILFMPITSLAAEKSTDAKVLELLQRKYTGVKWENKSIIKADINCDGKTDAAVLGKEGEKVVVAVIPGPLAKESKILLTRLLVGKHSQDSLCGPHARLSIEDQDYDPAEIFDGEKLPGFRRSKTCKGINVSDGECDSFHFFWNYELKAVQWWRL